MRPPPQPNEASVTMSSDDEEDRFHVPRGVIRQQRKGWDGEDLELEHQRETNQADSSAATAVDLNQFRNTEVGKGYQAKHVVRQRVAQEESVKIQDMSVPREERKEKKKKRKREEKQASDKKTKGSKGEEDSTGANKLQRYLRCEAMRNLRRELESIVKSA